MSIDERKQEWIKAFRAAGHEFVMDEGQIDWFHVDGGMHNGPGCVKCGYSCCHHCTSPDQIPKCKTTQ